MARSPELSPTNPDLYDHTVCMAGFLCVLLHQCLHTERRIACSDGVVLEGHRSAKKRHYAVAHHLVDCPLVAVDRLHHALENGV